MTCDIAPRCVCCSCCMDEKSASASSPLVRLRQWPNVWGILVEEHVLVNLFDDDTHIEIACEYLVVERV